MKRLCCLLALIFLALPAPSSADIIPEGMKPVPVFAVLDNAADYPNLVFIAVETRGDSIQRQQVVGPDGRIRKGYKLNRLILAAMPVPLFDQRGGLGSTDLLADPKVLRFDTPLEAGVRYEPATSNLAGQTVHYQVTTVSDGSLILEKARIEDHESGPGPFPWHLFQNAFLITLAVELLVFILLLRVVFRSRTPNSLRALTSVAAAQLATLPLLWFVITRYGLTGIGVTLAAEAFAVGVETVIYRFLAGLTWQRALAASLVCNGASWLLGVLG